jgi:amino-acid N-acetyltransferase
MILRKAISSDQSTIRRMVNDARINPMQLDWRRFLLAVDDAQNQVIGCAQVKPHGDGTRELASLVVLPARRGQGIARALIERLMSENPPPLYLTCQSGLEPLYWRFSFKALSFDEMTPYFRRLWKLVGFLRRFMPGDPHLSVMRWDGPLT